MSFFYFPGELVYWEKTPCHERMKEKLLPTIMDTHNKRKNNPFQSSDLDSSFYYNDKILTENSFLNDNDLLNNVIFKAVENMTYMHNAKGTFPISYRGLVLQSAWWNYYDEGQYQEPHTHLGGPVPFKNELVHPLFSVVYILQDTNDENNLIFQKPAPVPFTGCTEPALLDTCLIDKNSMSEGTVIIFPVGLSHMVKPCKKPGRITIAFNICASLGSK